MESYLNERKSDTRPPLITNSLCSRQSKGIFCWESSKQPQFNNYIEWLAGNISIPYSKFQKMHQWTFQFKLWKIKAILVFRSLSFPTEQLYANFCWNLFHWDCIRLKRCVMTSRYVYIFNSVDKILVWWPQNFANDLHLFLELPVNLKKLSQPKQFEESNNVHHTYKHLYPIHTN